MPCLMGPRFHISEPSGSEEEYFSISSMDFCGFNFKPMTPSEGSILVDLGHYLSKLGYGTNFKQLRLKVLEKTIFRLYLSAQDPWGRTILNLGFEVTGPCYIQNSKHLRQMILKIF